MADIALDDLIKKDRETKKEKTLYSKKPNKPHNNHNSNNNHRNNNARPHPRKNGDRFEKPRRFDRSQENGARQPERKKYIQKRDKFQSQPQQRNDLSSRLVDRSRVEEERVDDSARRLRIAGLHPDITSEDLFKLFSQEGALEMCRVDQDNFGRSQTTASVVYHDTNSARQAIANLNNTKIMNSVITVEFFRKKKF